MLISWIENRLKKTGLQQRLKFISTNYSKFRRDLTKNKAGNKGTVIKDHR